MRAFTIRIPADLTDSIDEQAKACHRTRNQQIRYLLELSQAARQSPNVNEDSGTERAA